MARSRRKAKAAPRPHKRFAEVIEAAQRLYAAAFAPFPFDLDDPLPESEREDIADQERCAKYYNAVASAYGCAARNRPRLAPDSALGALYGEHVAMGPDLKFVHLFGPPPAELVTIPLLDHSAAHYGMPVWEFDKDAALAEYRELSEKSHGPVRTTWHPGDPRGRALLARRTALALCAWIEDALRQFKHRAPRITVQKTANTATVASLSGRERHVPKLATATMDALDKFKANGRHEFMHRQNKARLLQDIPELLDFIFPDSSGRSKRVAYLIDHDARDQLVIL